MSTFIPTFILNGNTMTKIHFTNDIITPNIFLSVVPFLDTPFIKYETKLVSRNGKQMLNPQPLAAKCTDSG